MTIDEAIQKFCDEHQRAPWLVSVGYTFRDGAKVMIVYTKSRNLALAAIASAGSDPTYHGHPVVIQTSGGIRPL